MPSTRIKGVNFQISISDNRDDAILAGLNIRTPNINMTFSPNDAQKLYKFMKTFEKYLEVEE